MATEVSKSITIDARELPPDERHAKIIQIFAEMERGQELHIISTHEPVHLIQQIRHEGIDFVESAYNSVERSDGSFETTLIRGEDSKSKGVIKITSIDKERLYSRDRFSPINIYSTENYRVILTYIKRGQCIPVHSPSVDLIFAVLNGTGKATVGNTKTTLNPGSIIIVPRGEKRGIVAETDMEAIHIVSPIPDEKDHLDVERKILRKECD